MPCYREVVVVCVWEGGVWWLWEDGGKGWRGEAGGPEKCTGHLIEIPRVSA